MPIKYIPFFPEPIEGQALLDNFKRTLRYKGAYEVTGKLKRGMPLYEMEKQETIGTNPDGNMVIRGECVSACAYLKEQGITVDLVYIDPPFASGADYAKKIYIRRNPKVAEAIANGKPVMIFGHGGFEHGPGIYQIGNETQCRTAIEAMQQDGEITTQAVRNYFKAFADSSLCVYSPIEGAEPELVEKSRKEIVELAVSEIRNGLLKCD